MEPIVFLPIISAIVSSVATIFLNNYFTKKRECEKSKKDLHNNKLRLARAFWSEIEALFDLYDTVKLECWENQNDQASFNMVNIQYDYISIFNANADKIGIFPSEDAKEFLKFYIFTKAYIDSLRELSRRWKKHIERCEQFKLNPLDKRIADVFYESCDDLFSLYQICYDQQTEFYRRRDEVKKTFEKYI